MVGLFSPAFVGRECDDRLTTGTALAPSPTLPLPGKAESLRFPPSTGGWRLSAAFLSIQKERKNCSLHGQMADCFLAAPLRCPFSHCPDTHTHTCTHTPTESSLPPGKINKCKPSLQRFIPPWSCASFLLMMAKSWAAHVLPGPALCSGRLSKGMMCWTVVGRVP